MRNVIQAMEARRIYTEPKDQRDAANAMLDACISIFQQHQPGDVDEEMLGAVMDECRRWENDGWVHLDDIEDALSKHISHFKPREVATDVSMNWLLAIIRDANIEVNGLLTWEQGLRAIRKHCEIRTKGRVAE